MSPKLNTLYRLQTKVRSPLFYYESWQNDICSFRAMTVTLTVSVKLIFLNIFKQFLTFIFAVLLECHLMGQIKVNLYCICNT